MNVLLCKTTFLARAQEYASYNVAADLAWHSFISYKSRSQSPWTVVPSWASAAQMPKSTIRLVYNIPYRRAWPTGCFVQLLGRVRRASKGILHTTIRPAHIRASNCDRTKDPSRSYERAKDVTYCWYTLYTTYHRIISAVGSDSCLKSNLD